MSTFIWIAACLGFLVIIVLASIAISAMIRGFLWYPETKHLTDLQSKAFARLQFERKARDGNFVPKEERQAIIEALIEAPEELVQLYVNGQVSMERFVLAAVRWECEDPEILVCRNCGQENRLRLAEQEGACPCCGSCGAPLGLGDPGSHGASS